MVVEQSPLRCFPSIGRRRWRSRDERREEHQDQSVRRVEIELKSTKEFPVRDAVIELRVGAQTFRRSRPGPDGSLNTIIFVLTHDEFDRINTGDAVTVGFSHERR